MALTGIEQSFVMQLANLAVRALVLAGGASLGLAAFRVKTASTQLFTWTAVLYAVLALPLVGGLVPPLPVPTPAFLSDVLPPEPSQASQSFAASPASSTVLDTSVPRGGLVEIAPTRETVGWSPHVRVNQPRTTPPSVPATASSSFLASFLRPSIRGSTITTALYLIVASILMARIIAGYVFGRRLIRTSRSIRGLRVPVKLAAMARAAGLAAIPEIGESGLISVPLTIGVLRGTILLPTSWHEWDDAKLDAVVAHEVSHVARRDALTQRLALLHRAIFWFSPLAWWLDRHLADLAEQASDEAALSSGVDRNDYARTLLGFFEALQATPGRVWWQGVSMAKPGQAEQRLERILAWRGAVTMGFKKSLAVMIIAVAVPAVYLAASVRPAASNLGGQGLTPPPAARPAPRAQPGSRPAPPAVASSAPEAPPADTLPEPALAPAAPDSETFTLPGRSLLITPPWPGQSAKYRGYSYAYGYDDEQRFVIVSGKSDSYTMSGSTEDIRHVERLKKQIPGDFIWFQRDEKSYVVRDQVTIDRARKLFVPQEELGKKQEVLGKQQEELGKQQEELGAKMEQTRVKVPDMTAELDELRAELKQLSAGATAEQIGRVQSKIGELQSKIGEVQSDAGDEQSKLGEAMGALGEKQGELGERQGELGRQQAELAEKAARQMKELLDEALKKGTAQPEPAIGEPTL